jgi:hypothetical protein
MVVELVEAWTKLLISTLQIAGDQDWPIAHGARAIDQVFMALRVSCHVQILLDSADMILDSTVVRR